MARPRVHATNSARQRAYRERKRSALRNDEPQSVTKTSAVPPAADAPTPGTREWVEQQLARIKAGE
jgi:hypothetical protein